MDWIKVFSWLPFCKHFFCLFHKQTMDVLMIMVCICGIFVYLFVCCWSSSSLILMMMMMMMKWVATIILIEETDDEEKKTFSFFSKRKSVSFLDVVVVYSLFLLKISVPNISGSGNNSTNNNRFVLFFIIIIQIIQIRSYVKKIPEKKSKMFFLLLLMMMMIIHLSGVNSIHCRKKWKKKFCQHGWMKCLVDATFFLNFLVKFFTPHFLHRTKKKSFKIFSGFTLFERQRWTAIFCFLEILKFQFFFISHLRTEEENQKEREKMK